MLICLIGPSAVGKTTIENELENRGIASKLISTTDRSKRPKEPDDAYHFVTTEEFDKTPLTESTTYAGAKYGLSVDELNRTNDTSKDFVFVCEINGALQMKEFCKVPMTMIFLDAQNDALIRRLQMRGTADIDKRIARIDEDKKSAIHCHHVVRNEDGYLEDSIKEITYIIHKERKEYA